MPNSPMPPVNILIVDDQLADRLATRAECQRAFDGILNLDEAETINAAISKMATRIYQIVLLDKDLGVDEAGEAISGIDHIRLLQEIQPVSKIIHAYCLRQNERGISGSEAGRLRLHRKGSR